MAELGWIILEAAIKGIIIVMLLLLSAAVSVYLERKIAAYIQGRYGPNRVGPFGLMQPIVDVVKLFMKEDLVPKAASPYFHKLAPIISLGVAFAVYAVIPFAHSVSIGSKTIYLGIAPNANVGILFLLAMTSVGVYGLTLAGWSSNNKYSLLGGLRSSAQMISYELSMGISLLGVLMIVGSFSLNDISLHQSGWFWNWHVFVQPLGFILFVVAAFAELNRTPFDLPEAEPELVGGYNTEYSGMKFGMFFLSEYANVTTSAAIITLLFLGGWHLPFPQEYLGLAEGSILLALVQVAVFLAKIVSLIVFVIWVRWTVPRFRYDQLMRLGWRVLLPLSIINVVLTAIVIYILR